MPNRLNTVELVDDKYGLCLCYVRPLTHRENLELAIKYDIDQKKMTNGDLEAERRAANLMEEVFPSHVIKAELERGTDGEDPETVAYPFGPEGLWKVSDLTAPEAGQVMSALYDMETQLAAGVAAARRFRRPENRRELGQG